MLKLLVFAFLISSMNCEEWIRWSVNKTSEPKDSVLVASDIQGSYYVIRVVDNEDTFIGKFSPEHQQLFISQENESSKNVTSFEVKEF